MSMLTPCGSSADEKTTEKVPIKEASLKQLQDFVRKQKSDRIVVVDLWSTACLPCLKEFPGLVRLKAEYGEPVSYTHLTLPTIYSV